MRAIAIAAVLATLSLPALAATGIGSPAGTTDPAAVKAGTYTLDPAHGKITWAVDHLGFSTYIGQFSAVSATLTLKPTDLALSKLSVSVDMNSVGTLNPKLDEMLKSGHFFEVTKYPTATFFSTHILRTGKSTANVDGNLTLHGVTKPIVLKIQFNQAGSDPIDNSYVAGFSATATIDRSDFGVSAFSPLLSNEIPLQIEGECKLK